MKYVDKRFIAYKEKQSESESEGCFDNRASKRKRSRRYYLFYQSEIKSLIDRLWWNNLKDSDKEDIMDSYYLNKQHIEAIDIYKDNRWYNYEVFDTLVEWSNWINKSYKPNKAGLRNDKLKELGI